MQEQVVTQIQSARPRKRVPGQAVFRAHPPPYLAKVSTTAATSPNENGSEPPRTRKAHRKSRAGCRNCKMRRVKCDETRDGGCLKCRSLGIDCDYLTPKPSPATRHFALVKKSDLVNGGSSPGNVVLPTSPAATVTYSLSFVPQLPIKPTHTNGMMTDPLAVFHHFNTLTSHTCGSIQGQRVMQSYMLEVAMQTPYLMHALLGTAAAHMAYLLPADVNAVQHSKHNLADAYHWDHSLKLFRRELSRNGANKANMDALLSTLMLVSVQQFCARPRSSPSAGKSFVCLDSERDREDALQFLSVQSGFSILIRQLGQHLVSSAWITVLHDANIHEHVEPCGGKTWEQAYPNVEADETELMFCDLCKIDDFSKEENNPYYLTLEVLLHLRRMRPIRNQHFNKIITFLGKINSNFEKLLIDRDVRALLILLHWLPLILSIDQWWIVPRVKQECAAIIQHLNARAKAQKDETITLLLREPVAAIGIVI